MLKIINEYPYLISEVQLQSATHITKWHKHVRSSLWFVIGSIFSVFTLSIATITNKSTNWNLLLNPQQNEYNKIIPSYEFKMHPADLHPPASYGRLIDRKDNYRFFSSSYLLYHSAPITLIYGNTWSWIMIHQNKHCLCIGSHNINMGPFNLSNLRQIKHKTDIDNNQQFSWDNNQQFS